MRSKENDLWSIWRVPVGSEDNKVKERVLQGERVNVTQAYESMRQLSADGSAIVLTDGRGDVVFACS